MATQPWRKPRYDIRELLATVIGDITPRQLALMSRGRLSWRAWDKAIERRWLTYEQADRMACTLGLHPSLVWPSWFDDALTDLPVPKCLPRKPRGWPTEGVRCYIESAPSERRHRWRQNKVLSTPQAVELAEAVGERPENLWDGWEEASCMAS